MKAHFISLAICRTPSTPMHQALERIKKQAALMNIFDVIHGYTENDLKSDVEYWNKHKKFMETSKRAYGYMLYKPYLIKKHLETLDEGDILIYCDAGCEIRKNENYMVINHNLFDKLQENKLLACPHNLFNHLKHYTKQICYNFFNVTEADFLSTKTYVESGRIFLIKTKATVKIINEWWDAMDNHYNLYDSTATAIPELLNFKDSRHDQMILQFILLKNNFLTQKLLLSADAASVFVAARNKTGISIQCRGKDKCECQCCS
jgi:hypothetical protein